uniref:Uncharacterized protein n=1 Tax=Aegilops tauschii subsp. strangulata TaxID=200361 RepID=A0A453P4C5_AEGTS
RLRIPGMPPIRDEPPPPRNETSRRLHCRPGLGFHTPPPVSRPLTTPSRAPPNHRHPLHAPAHTHPTLSPQPPSRSRPVDSDGAHHTPPVLASRRCVHPSGWIRRSPVARALVASNSGDSGGSSPTPTQPPRAALSPG